MTDDQYRELVEFLARKFGRIDKRFDQIDERFEQIDGRLDRIELRLTRVEVLVDQNRGRIQLLAESISALNAKVDRMGLELG